LEIKDDFNVLIIAIGKTLYAVASKKVEEVVQIMKINPFPQKLEFVEGFVEIRGVNYGIIDLRKRFGGERKNYLMANRIILSNIKDHHIGYVVDEIVRIENWGEHNLQEGVLAKEESFVLAIGRTEEGNIQLLDIENILDEKELSHLQVYRRGD